MHIRHILLSGLLIASALLPRQLSAQGVVIAPARASADYRLSEKTDRLLEEKMKSALTAQGISSVSEFARFALEPSVAILDEHTSTGVPPKTTMSCSITFSIVDVMTGNVFDSYTIETEGKGTNKTNTLHKAIAAIRLASPDFNAFVNRSRVRVEDYYESQLDNIISMARSSATQGDYEYALYILSEVPSSIRSYSRVAKAIDECYADYREAQALAMLQKAEAIWTASPNASGAQDAMKVLEDIPMGTKYDSKVKALMSKISSKLSADEKRRWDLIVKEAERRHQEKQSVIKAARDVAVAYARNQPKTISETNIILW